MFLVGRGRKPGNSGGAEGRTRILGGLSRAAGASETVRRPKIPFQHLLKKTQAEKDEFVCRSCGRLLLKVG